MLEHVGQPREFDFEPRDHLEIGQLLGAIDTERGAKVSGARFYYLTGVGAQLQLAMLNLAMAQALEAGFVPVVPPVLVKPEAMEGTGFLAQAAENVYHLAEEDLYLVGTSEVPLAAFHMDEVLDADRLPLRYAGWSTCFRKEAGSYGKDTRGILRVHQFDKIEMFSYVDPADAAAEHLRLLDWEKQMLAKVEVPYRVIDVAAGDLGGSAARKYDCEAWVPTQGRYRELTSTSNCTTFQARRLRIRMRDADGAAAAGDAERHPGHDPLDRRDPGEPPAGRRLGGGAAGTTAVPRWPRGARAGRDMTDAAEQPAEEEPSLRELRLACTRFLNGHGHRPPSVIVTEVREVLGEVEADRYGEGGVVEELESEVAELLGKPAAVLMPSGTMAQQIALRVHADRTGRRTVLLAPHVPHRAVGGPGGRTAARPARPAGGGGT